MSCPRIFMQCSCLIALLTISSTAIAAPQASNSKALEDLGEELLGDDLLRQLQPAPEDTKPKQLPSVDELRRMLDPELQQPQEGEDLGQARKSPLVSISDRMQAAGKLIASQNTSGETQAVQQEIVSELDELIDKLNKQCQQCQGGQSSKPQDKQQSQSSTPKPGSAKPAPAQATQSSQSTPQPSQVSQGGGGEAQPGEAADADVVKKLWGQLPERLRQQLLQSSADEFLPKYRADLEAYFRRLAEEQQGAPSGQ